MLETYLVSLGVAVRPIWVAEAKYSRISRHAESSAALPRELAKQLLPFLAYLGARQYQDAEVWIDDALREQPRFHASIRVKVSLCGLLGRNEEARDLLGRLLDLQPGLTIAAWAAHAATFLAPETKALMIVGLRQAGLPE